MLDMTVLDAASYGGNPALKIPVLIDEHGPLFGTENICRALLARKPHPGRVIMRGDIGARVVANAEEITMHVVTSEVSLIMAKAAGDVRMAPPKVIRSVENSLDFLDAHIDEALAALPDGRAFSFLEVALYCVVRHLPFRQVLEVTRWNRLGTFCDTFEQRESARQTPYRFDAP